MRHMVYGWLTSGLLLLIVLTLAVPQPAEKVAFLDIGQGDSILLQHGTQQVLIDGGPGNAVLQRLSEELPWADTTIEVVIATHPDKDHLEGLLHVLERYNVKLVLLPKVPHTSQLQEDWLARLQRAVEAKHIAYRFAWAGQQLRLQDMTLRILGPVETPNDVSIAGKTNNAGVLTRVDMPGLSLLLTADAEEIVEKALVARSDPATLDVDILKAGHHGSKTSTSAALLAVATPSSVVISVGAKNSYGHPNPVTLQRLKPYPVFRTDQSGTIRFTHSNRDWLVSCGLKPLLPWSESSCINSSESKS